MIPTGWDVSTLGLGDDAAAAGEVDVPADALATEVGAAEPYSEGIIDYLRAVEGAEMAALIREPPRRDGPARRVSLRASSDKLDVSAIARKSDGGGHRQAAGFSSDKSVEEITDFIHREFVDAAAGA